MNTTKVIVFIIVMLLFATGSIVVYNRYVNGNASASPPQEQNQTTTTQEPTPTQPTEKRGTSWGAIIGWVLAIVLLIILIVTKSKGTRTKKEIHEIDAEVRDYYKKHLSTMKYPHLYKLIGFKFGEYRDDSNAFCLVTYGLDKGSHSHYFQPSRERIVGFLVDAYTLKIEGHYFDQTMEEMLKEVKKTRDGMYWMQYRETGKNTPFEQAQVEVAKQHLTAKGQATYEDQVASYREVGV